MKGEKLEIISQIVLWYENSFRIDCEPERLTENGAWIAKDSQKTRTTCFF